MTKYRCQNLLTVDSALILCKHPRSSQSKMTVCLRTIDVCQIMLQNKYFSFDFDEPCVALGIFFSRRFDEARVMTDC